jgi:hypothetical protein
MKNMIWTAAIWGVLSCQSFAGVVIEMVSRDPGSNQEALVNRIYAEGTMVRIESHQEGTPKPTIVIYRDEALLYIQPEDQTYYRMDEDLMSKMSSQISWTKT